MARPNCSYISKDGKHCEEAATHGCVILIGNWGTNCLMCTKHVPYLEAQMPVDPETGAPMLSILSQVVRAPIIFKLDEIPPDEGELIPVTMNCDQCHVPIYRLKLPTGGGGWTTEWAHVPDAEGNVDKSHEAYPG